jgi:hypothetical protein
MKIFDYSYDERHYGWVIDKHYDWLNMLVRLQKRNPNRFNEFQYSSQTIYHYLDRLQHEQNLYDGSY